MPAAARLKEERRAKRRNRWGNAAEGDGAKKKRSRWELADPGITEQVQLKLRLDDIQRKLALPDCGVATEDPSQRRAPARSPHLRACPPARLPAPGFAPPLPAPRPLTRALLRSGRRRRRRSMTRLATGPTHARSGRAASCWASATVSSRSTRCAALSLLSRRLPLAMR